MNQRCPASATRPPARSHACKQAVMDLAGPHLKRSKVSAGDETPLRTSSGMFITGGGRGRGGVGCVCGGGGVGVGGGGGVGGDGDAVFTHPPVVRGDPAFAFVVRPQPPAFWRYSRLAKYGDSRAGKAAAMSPLLTAAGPNPCETAAFHRAGYAMDAVPLKECPVRSLPLLQVT